MEKINEVLLIFKFYNTFDSFDKTYNQQIK